MNSFEGCPVGVKHESEIAMLKKVQEDTAKDVKDIKEKLLGRPTWAVTVIITVLTTLAASSLTFAFTMAREVTKGILLK